MARALRTAFLPTLLLFTLGAATLASLPTVAQTATPACPALQLDNPTVGDTVMPGGYVVSGIAFHPSASVGSGVSRVDLFLGAREDSGLYLGSAQSIPNANNFGPPRFQAQITIPKIFTGDSVFVAYAFDALSSGQTSVAVPVHVGDSPPQKSQATVTAQVTSTCAAVATPVGLAPALPAEIAFTPTLGPQLAGPRVPSGGPVADPDGPFLQLDAPNPGDLVPIGGYVVSGTAYDPAAAQVRGWIAPSSSSIHAKTAAGCSAPRSACSQSRRCAEILGEDCHPEQRAEGEPCVRCVRAFVGARRRGKYFNAGLRRRKAHPNSASIARAAAARRTEPLQSGPSHGIAPTD